MVPTYEYMCADCREKMEVFASISEREKGLKLKCPECGSKKMVQLFGQINVIGSKGSMGSSGCGHKSGPGCCG